VFALFLCLANRSQAQKKQPATIVSATFSLPVIPGPNFDIGIQPGIQLNFPWQSVAWVTELAIKVAHPDKPDVQDHKYFRVKSELKYFTAEKPRKSPFFVAFEVAYARRSFTNLDGGYYFTSPKNKETAFYYDAAKIRSPIFTAAFKAGWDIFLSHRLRLDMSSGLGFRHINTSFSDLVNLREDNFESGFRLFTPAYRFKGSLSRLHFTTCVRIACRL
jgi:hypothetical protein